MDAQLVALTLMTAAESAHAFSAWMPSYFTIRTFALDGSQDEIERKLRNLRSGYLPSVTFSLGLGAVVSWIAKHPLPLAAAAATSAFMVWQYERALPAAYRRLPGAQRPCLPGSNGQYPVQGGIGL